MIKGEREEKKERAKGKEGRLPLLLIRVR